MYFARLLVFLRSKKYKTRISMASPTFKNRTRDEIIAAFRSYKQRKREWQASMEIKLAQEEEEIRRKRESLYAEFV